MKERKTRAQHSHAIMHQEGKYTVVLIGPKEHGKTSSCNMLLGRRILDTKTTKTACIDEVIIKQESFEVIDTPGANSMSRNEAIANAREVMTLAKSGITAFLFVISHTTNFTDTKRVMSMLTDIYGQDALDKYGICLMTDGDMVTKVNFNNWRETITGPLKDFLRQFNNRIVLVNNLGIKSERDFCQVEVLDIVRKLSQQQDPYTEEDFKKQEAIQQTQVVRSDVECI